MLRNSFEKRLRMEVLESKIPMAADVSIAVLNGDLLITGDDGVNSLLIEPHPDFAPGHYVIYNRGQADDTVNGEIFPTIDVGGGPKLALEVTGVTRDVIVNLNGGDDIFRVTGVFAVDGSQDLLFPRDLVVNLGANNDQFYAGVYESFISFQGPVTVTRNLQIVGGSGDDTLLTTALNVGNNLSYSDTSGTNFFSNDPTFIYALGRRSNVGGSLSVNTGSDTDFITLEEFDVNRNVAINVGAGDDIASVRDFSVTGSVSLGLGSGINNGVVEFTNARAVAIGGSGANVVTVQGVNAQSVTVLTGNNDDNVILFQVNANLTTIATFGGIDGVQIFDSAFDLLMVDLGAGNDWMELQGVTVDLVAILRGGGGTDSLTGIADNEINLLIDFGFEAIAGDL